MIELTSAQKELLENALEKVAGRVPELRGIAVAILKGSVRVLFEEWKAKDGSQQPPLPRLIDAFDAVKLLSRVMASATYSIHGRMQRIETRESARFDALKKLDGSSDYVDEPERPAPLGCGPESEPELRELTPVELEDAINAVHLALYSEYGLAHYRAFGYQIDYTPEPLGFISVPQDVGPWKPIESFREAREVIFNRENQEREDRAKAAKAVIDLM